MIRKSTSCVVLDNSGADRVRCIQVYRSKVGKLGSTLLVSVKKLRFSERKVQRKEVYKALVVLQRYGVRRYNGIGWTSDLNSVVLLRRSDKSLIGSRVRGVLPYDLRWSGQGRLLLLSEGAY